MTTPTMYWKLAEDGRTAVPADDVMDMSRAMDGPRHVGDDSHNGIRVSTVFLGINHAFNDGPPVLWETLVFMPDGEDGERYTSYEDAEAGHARYVAKYL